jgi:hypothetical protein
MWQKEFLERNKPENLKHRLFRVFHNLIETFDIPVHVLNLILVIEVLQMMNYACHSTLPRLWPDFPLNYIQIVLSSSDLSFVWKNYGGYFIVVFSVIGTSQKI